MIQQITTYSFGFLGMYQSLLVFLSRRITQKAKNADISIIAGSSGCSKAHTIIFPLFLAEKT